MLHTDVRRAGAIGLFFFCSGCIVNLDERGVVAVSASRPANADRVVVALAAGESRIELELGERIELAVPAGSVRVTGEALLGTEVIGSDEQVVDVARGATVEVMLQLLDGVDGGMGDTGVSDTGAPDSGVPEVRSVPIEATLRVRTDGINGSILAGEEGTSDEFEFLDFRSDAQSELGVISSISVSSVSIQLLPGSTGVGTLDDLWSDQITASIVREDGSAFVEVAGGVADSGSSQAELDGIGADLAPLSSSLTSGRFKVGLRGVTPRNDSDDFDAMVRAAVTYVAR